MKDKEKFVCLMSGGTDSPVACYLTIKQGYIPLIVHFHKSLTDPLSDEILANGVFAIIKILSNFLDEQIKTYLIDHNLIIKELQQSNAGRNICVLCRRMMYRIAKEIALENEAKAIVTGESLGEKASQTPMNLYIMKESVGDFLIIQPLIALFKLEIENIAKKIGTYKASIQKAYSCTANPKYPVTYANLDKILEIEAKININDLIQQSLKSAKILYF